MLAGLMFASGLSALIYQVLWIKQLTLIFGTDAVAVTASLSAFAAGLGCGNFFLAATSTLQPNHFCFMAG